MLQDLADHISNRISEIETPANSIGVGKVAAHLKDVYDSLRYHQYNHKSGHILDAQSHLSDAARGIGHAEDSFQQAFPGEKLRPNSSSPVSMKSVASEVATHYTTSDVPGVGSNPDKDFTGTIPSKRKYTTKAEKDALEAAKPAIVKKIASLTPEQNAKNKEAFESKNPKAAPTSGTDRMVREATRAKLSAIADIKRRYPEAPDGAPQATFDYHVNKATEALNAGQPIAYDTGKFLGREVVHHVKRAVQQAKLSGGIKANYTDSGEELENAPVTHVDNEVKVPSSDESAGEVTLRPGRGARGGSISDFTEGRG
jgi:hypothetical protein